MIKPYRVLTSRQNQMGASLIEVLVATVVISIGLLSLASLQIVATRGNQIAYHQSQATMLALDLSERIRAMAPADRNNYARTANAAAPNCLQGLANNDRINTAATDNAHWLNTLACSLPQSNATVAFAADNELRVTITWRDDRELNIAGNPTINTFNYVTRL